MGRVLVDQGVLTESNLVAALAAQIGLDFIDLGDVLIDPEGVVRLHYISEGPHDRPSVQTLLSVIEKNQQVGS